MSIGYVLAAYILFSASVAATDSDYLTVAAPASDAASISYGFSYLTELPQIPTTAVTVVPIDEVRANEVAIAKDFLSKRNSPMTPYAEIIVDTARRCGGDYRILLAIAEVESGSGRKPYLKYNPFGYLNKVRYASWASALTDLSCKISKQYILVYGTDFWRMAKRYTGQAEPVSWSGKVNKIYKSF